MDRNTVAEVLARPIARELLESSIPARLAYVGVDGDPRVVPVAFLWTGSRLVVDFDLGPATGVSGPAARARAAGPRPARTPVR